jgi:L-lactate dehydrogenase complex protein LldG
VADLALFRERVERHGGVVHETASRDAARALARDLIAGASVAAWRDAILDTIVDDASPPERAEVSLIAADVAVAQTGAIGFVHRDGRPRAVALLPERQIALLALDDLVDTMAQALARFYGAADPPPASLVFVAGPSRTSDIEQRSIRGVHAPKALDVIAFRA